MIEKPVRVRIAPSPTGNCHVGTARNALFNLLFARQHGGKFILRIDDTDSRRSTRESEQGVLEGLRWLGLDWDEGPDVGGPFGPYRQSERLDLYRDLVQKLLDEGKAYYSFDTPEELERERTLALANGQPPRYSGRDRDLSTRDIQARLAAGLRPTVRLKITPGPMTFVDLIQGVIEQDVSSLSDPVIQRSNGMPTYNFVTVVDEHAMQISHAFRSAEHINNTYPQLQIYAALGFEPPKFGHFALLLNPDRSKISKRTGAVYIGEFRDLGYLPETMINSLALAGWNPATGQEIFSLDELIAAFALDQCSQSNAIFDRQKLLWMNGLYIRSLPLDSLTRRVIPFLVNAGLLPSPDVSGDAFEHLKGIVALEQERLKTLAEAPHILGFFFRDPDVQDCIDLLRTNKYTRKHTPRDLAAALRETRQILDGLGEWTPATLQTTLDAQVVRLGWRRGDLLMPIRITVSGSEATPSVFEMLVYIGRAAVLRRLDVVLAELA